MQWNFSDLKNPRFIFESGFKSRAGYNGARTVSCENKWEKKSSEVFSKSLFSSKTKDRRGKVTVICGAKVGWLYIGLGSVTFL